MTYNTKIQEDKKEDEKKRSNPPKPDVKSKREIDQEPVEENSDQIREQEPEVDVPVPGNEKTEKKIPEMKNK